MEPTNPARSHSDATPRSTAGAVRFNPRNAVRGFLVLDILARLFIWGAAAVLATVSFNALSLWPRQSPFAADFGAVWRWGLSLTGWVLVFNVVYVSELILLRLPVPTPREGRYPLAGGKLDRQILCSCLLALLTKARYEPPFPGFLVFQLANVPPLCWLMSPLFGPRSRSCYVTDPRILDPHFVTIGRNVTIGFNATISGHYQERDTVVFKRTVIEDNVLIGANAGLFGDVYVKTGSVIAGGAVVLPGSVVGPNEYWAGVPARRIRNLPPVDASLNP